jgi:hypothetical protein
VETLRGGSAPSLTWFIKRPFEAFEIHRLLQEEIGQPVREDIRGQVLPVLLAERTLGSYWL